MSNQRWIPVDERLPECDRSKDENLGWLVYKPKAARKVEVFYWHPSWWHADDDSSQKITHWMPLPEPPEVPVRMADPSSPYGDDYDDGEEE